MCRRESSESLDHSFCIEFRCESNRDDGISPKPSFSFLLPLGLVAVRAHKCFFVSLERLMELDGFGVVSPALLMRV